MNFLEALQQVKDADNPTIVARSVDIPYFSLQLADGGWNELILNEETDNRSGKSYFRFEYNRDTLGAASVPVALTESEWELCNINELPERDDVRPTHERDVMMKFDAMDVTDEEIEEIEHNNAEMERIQDELGGKTHGNLAEILGFTDDEVRQGIGETVKLDLDNLDLPPPSKRKPIKPSGFRRIT